MTKQTLQFSWINVCEIGRKRFRAVITINKTNEKKKNVKIAGGISYGQEIVLLELRFFDIIEILIKPFDLVYVINNRRRILHI